MKDVEKIIREINLLKPMPQVANKVMAIAQNPKSSTSTRWESRLSGYQLAYSMVVSAQRAVSQVSPRRTWESPVMYCSSSKLMKPLRATGEKRANVRAASSRAATRARAGVARQHSAPARATGLGG